MRVRGEASGLRLALQRGHGERKLVGVRAGSSGPISSASEASSGSGGGRVLLMVVDAQHCIPEGRVPCAVAQPRVRGALVQQEAERDRVVSPGGQHERCDAVVCVEGRVRGPFA